MIHAKLAQIVGGQETEIGCLKAVAPRASLVAPEKERTADILTNRGVHLHVMHSEVGRKWMEEKSRFIVLRQSMGSLFPPLVYWNMGSIPKLTGIFCLQIVY